MISFNELRPITQNPKCSNALHLHLILNFLLVILNCFFNVPRSLGINRISKFTSKNSCHKMVIKEKSQNHSF